MFQLIEQGEGAGGFVFGTISRALLLFDHRDKAEAFRLSGERHRDFAQRSLSDVPHRKLVAAGSPLYLGTARWAAQEPHDPGLNAVMETKTQDLIAEVCVWRNALRDDRRSYKLQGICPGKQEVSFCDPGSWVELRVGRSSLDLFSIESAPSHGGYLDDTSFTGMRTTFLAPDVFASFDRGEERAELHGVKGRRGIVEDMLESLAPIPAGQRRHAFEVGAGAAGAGEQRLDPRHDPALLGKGR